MFITLAHSAWWEQMPTRIACSCEDGVMYLAGKEVLFKGFIILEKRYFLKVL